jgi:prepilin-type N-terminal cleavage/methylation domain-containing protein
MYSKEIKRNNGFTLIELAIVIGILGILSSIAIPSFLTFLEKAADRVVKTSLMQSFKECQIDIISDEEIPTFQLDMGTVRRNGYYKFFQQYDYIPRKDGSIPPTILGNCIGPLGAHRLGVRKIKGKNKNGELWINLSTGERTEKGQLKWD